MEPILISSLKKHIQNAILNNQDKLNPNHNAYIEEEELGELLSFFGAKDIEELKETGLDTFKSTTKENPAEKTEEKIEDETEDKTASEESENDNKIDFKEYDTAANKLNVLVSKDIVLSSAGASMGTIYNQYLEQIQNAINSSEDYSSALNMIDFIDNTAMETIDIQNKYSSTSVSEEKVYTYGDGKEIRIRNTIDFGGNNSLYGETSASDSESDTDEGSSGNNNSGSNENKLDGGVVYAVEAQTENGKYLFKADMKTDNQDYYLAGVYNKELDNGANLAVSGVGEITVDTGSSYGSGGVAVDYKTNIFSTGAYFYGSYDDDDGEIDYSYSLEGYAKYKDNFRFSAGVERSYGITTPSLTLKLYGTKELKNDGLTLSGSLSANAGKNHFDKDLYEDTAPTYEYDVRARGGVAFKANDFSTNLDAMIVYRGGIDPSAAADERLYKHSLGGILLGKLRKGDIEASATLCAYRDLLKEPNANEPALTFASTFAIKYYNLMHKITPVISCTIGNNTSGSPAAIQAGIQTSW